MKRNIYFFLVCSTLFSCHNNPFDHIYPEEPKIISKSLNLKIQAADTVSTDATYNLDLDLDADSNRDFFVCLIVPYYPYPDDISLPLIASINSAPGNNHQILKTPFVTRGLSLGDSIIGEWETGADFKRGMGMRYFGFKMAKGNKKYYGWIKINNDGHRNSLEVLDYDIRLDGKLLKAGEK